MNQVLFSLAVDIYQAQLLIDSEVVLSGFGLRETSALAMLKALYRKRFGKELKEYTTHRTNYE